MVNKHLTLSPFMGPGFVSTSPHLINNRAAVKIITTRETHITTRQTPRHVDTPWRPLLNEHRMTGERGRGRERERERGREREGGGEREREREREREGGREREREREGEGERERGKGGHIMYNTVNTLKWVWLN